MRSINNKFQFTVDLYVTIAEKLYDIYIQHNYGLTNVWINMYEIAAVQIWF